ncbi:MAG: hypothetical protein C0179_05580 [Fervidicoccus sp.]|nr:MAG: hypothetical protein C0179_05580 [Fervidicoccus sp.]
MAVFKRVSKKKFDEIRDTLESFLRSRGWERTFRLKSLDEDEGIKRFIEFFEEISTVIVSVGDMTVYAVPLYYFDPRLHYGYYLVSFLVIKRDPSGYTIEIKYSDSLRGFIKASSREEVEKLVDKLFGGFIRLLEKAVSTGSPNATKLAELIECLDEIKTISFLEKIYGDEILNDTETISGLHSICSREADFFANDKVIVIPEMDLRVVRDKDSGRIFIYVYRGSDIYIYRGFYEVSPETKIFYDALFTGFRDLLKPEAVVEDEHGYRYSISSTEVAVEGRNVSLVAVGTYDQEKKNWRYLRDIFAITCDNRCSIYPFWEKHIINDIHGIDKHINFEGVKETLIRYILSSKEIQRRAREWMTKELTKKHTWEILPA